MGNWIETDKSKKTIFINFNGTDNSILRITQEGISEIPNGMNGFLLQASDLIRPFSYLPDVDVMEAFSDLKRLVFDNLCCELEQRYLILCWFISAFLSDFLESQAMMKFSGPSASGKSTGAKLLTLLLYGNKLVGAPPASSQAGQNPLLVIDNLESEDVTAGVEGLLIPSKDQSKSLVLITAIEPFPKAEMINRTIEIEFSRTHHSDDFVENEVSREIIRKRDAILSGILKLISSRVLTNGIPPDHLGVISLILEKILQLPPFENHKTA